MKKLHHVFLLVLPSCICISCNESGISPGSEAAWIKVVAENHVYDTRQIESDGSGNLFCSYNQTSYDLDTNFAIIKLDAQGNLIGEQQLTDRVIYEFVIDANGSPIIASYENGMVSLDKLPADLSGEPVAFSSCTLPVDPNLIINFFGLRFIKLSGGGFLAAGSFKYISAPSQVCLGFICRFDETGLLEMMDTLLLTPGPPNTVVTGCAEANDGYVLFGYSTRNSTRYSAYFLCKTDFSGSVLCLNIRTTSEYFPDNDSTSGFFCRTSPLIASADKTSFYGCAYNTRFNIPFAEDPVYTDDDNSLRVFRFSSCGDTLDFATVKPDDQNHAMDLLLLPNNDLLIAINPRPLIGAYYSGQQNAYVMHLDQELNELSVQQFQTNYLEYVSSICFTADSAVAYENAIQSFGGDGLRLQVTKADENGNF